MEDSDSKSCLIHSSVAVAVFSLGTVMASLSGRCSFRDVMAVLVLIVPGMKDSTEPNRRIVAVAMAAWACIWLIILLLT